MVHLVVHLVSQIEALGPMYLHEMWMYECFMSILNGYMSTRARPEVSMLEGYITEEAIESRGPFCNRVLKDHPKHVAFPRKQQAIGVDGVSDLDEFTQSSNMSLFVDDHPIKIRNVERSIPQSSLPYVCHDGQGRTIAA